jgi:hypothetical protein
VFKKNYLICNRIELYTNYISGSKLKTLFDFILSLI